MIEKTCETCGKKFEVFHYRIKTARFCSTKCSSTVFKKGMTSWLKGTKGLVKPNSGSFKKGCKPHGKPFKKGQRPWNKEKHPEYVQGRNHPRWKGGIRICGGYIYIFMPQHPLSTKQGYIRYSHLLMENKIGRYLNPNEVTHHINFNKLDDRIENLQLCTRSDHIKIHRSHQNTS